MRTEDRTNVRNSVIRLVLILLLAVAQIWFIVYEIMYFESHIPGFEHLIRLGELVVCLLIYGRDQNSAFKMPWILLIMIFPIEGLVLYALAGRTNLTRSTRRHFDEVAGRLKGRLKQDIHVIAAMAARDEGAANESIYIWNADQMPVCRNTDVTFYSDSVDGLKAQIEDLKKAEKFIFMEYHAIEDAESFAPIKKILFDKAKAGLDVRVFYDDVGSIGFLSKAFRNQMEAHGVQCRVFNPVMPLINIFMNNRDHRKITVIDGKVGFTGGYNLANEYFHITKPYGYWKDTGVRLEGDAVGNLTLIFLRTWDALTKKPTVETKLNELLAKPDYVASEAGFVQPYSDSPLDNENTGEEVYMNILRNAKRYCWFVTPYLIITDEMTREMNGAAKRGVDVRIITPGIPDKKLVYMQTRSYYKQLMSAGVRIFEYTPGFCHAKMCVSDDHTATVGTINLDFRSLYLHFENGVFFYDCRIVPEVKKDFEDMFSVSREVEDDQLPHRPLRLWQSILRLFSPLL